MRMTRPCRNLNKTSRECHASAVAALPLSQTRHWALRLGGAALLCVVLA
jgi:hypothetical protein